MRFIKCEFVIYELQSFNLWLENVLLWLILVGCLTHHSGTHHASSHHWISAHSSCGWGSWLFARLVFMILFSIVFLQEKSVDLTQTEHDEEVERHSRHVTDVEIFEIDS